MPYEEHDPKYGFSITSHLSTWRRSQIFFYVCVQIFEFCRTWQLGASGGMENGPRGFGCDLLMILQIFENQSKSRSANNSRKCLDLDPISRKHFLGPARAPPRL